MAKNKLADLRDHLFETLEALKDGSMDLARAKTVSEVAQTMINLAKVEVDMVRAMDGRGVEGAFFSAPAETRELPRIAAGPQPVRVPVKGLRG
jgi:hypothetical protein